MRHLILVSGIPLAQVEKHFSVDSSGFSTSSFQRWMDIRGAKRDSQRQFRKAHLICGTSTHVITDVIISKGNAGDSPFFSELVEQTGRLYSIQEISADMAYSSRANIRTVVEAQAVPFIPFKRNVARSHSPARYGMLWTKSLRFFRDHPEEFWKKYHLRSNVETVFSMLKRRYGSYIRTKNIISQTNEILAKCLCHNLAVLNQESFELNIDLDFQKCADVQIAHL